MSDECPWSGLRQRCGLAVSDHARSTLRPGGCSLWTATSRFTVKYGPKESALGLREICEIEKSFNSLSAIGESLTDNFTDTVPRIITKPLQ